MTVLLCPPKFIFTYVNTVIYCTQTGARLLGLKGEKDRFYDLIAVMVNAPTTLVVWAEVLTCDSFLVRWGGHAWFDNSIPLTITLYYLVASSLPPRKESHAVMKQKLGTPKME